MLVQPSARREDTIRNKMNPNRRKLRLKPIWVVSALLILVPVGLTWREMRRVDLNRQLIQAILDSNYQKGLDLVKQGADGTARKSERLNPLQVLLAVLKHFRPKPHPTSADDSGTCALNVLYDPFRQKNGVQFYTTKLGILENTPPGFEELADKLVEIGSPIGGNYRDGQSPLDLAVCYHHHDVVRALLERRHCLVEHPWIALGSADLIDLPVLTGHGADVNGAGPGGETALLVARSPQTEWLIAHGAKVNATSWTLDTPLLYACMVGYDTTALTLIDHGAKVGVRNRSSITPMLAACRFCSPKVVVEIYKRGGSVNDSDSVGQSCLTLSQANIDSKVFLWLIEHGANVNARDKNGTSVLMHARKLAASARTDNEIKLLLEHGSR